MTNTAIIPTISATDVANYLSSPIGATGSRYQCTDSAGNVMGVCSIIEMVGQTYKYAAVYHVSDTSDFYTIKLAQSNDLLNWTYVTTLVQNASMPKIVQVSGSNWILLVHEQWQNTGPQGQSAAPCRFAYELFYDFGDLLSGTIRATWTAPQYSSSNLDGTPSVYNASLALSGGYYVVNGQYGFHFFDGTRDVNAVTTTFDLFSPAGTATTMPSTASAYNAVITSAGAAGSIGQRDTLQTTTARFNLQEGNLTGVNDFSQWRVFLYTFGDSFSYPTGSGSATQLTITTPNGSTSIGNPSVNVVNSPSGSGYSLVVCYFIFGQGAGAGEAGPLIFYYDL